MRGSDAADRDHRRSSLLWETIMIHADPLQFAVPSLDDRSFWGRFDASAPLPPGVAAAMKDLEAIPDRLPLPPAADYLAAKRSNDRNRLDNHWRRTRPKLASLVISRCIAGIDDADRDDRLLNWVFDYTFEPTWVVSAHLPKFDLPLAGEAQLDLAATEMAMELAETRELLLPWLRQQSDTLDRSIVREIDRRCLTPFAKGAMPFWADTSKPGTMNWSGVCGGSLLAACESLAAQGEPRPEAWERAVQVVRFFIDKGFSETGECDEGVGYWSYGIDFACLGMMRLSAGNLRTRIDLERLKAVASYPGRAHLVGRSFFAGNDSAKTVSAPPITDWLAAVTGDAFLAWWMRQSEPTGFRTVPHLARALWAAEALRELPAPQQPDHPPARYLADQQVAIFQTRTPRGLLTFTLTGGHNAENHNHNDLGTFQVLLDEQTLIPDPGMPAYTSAFFGPQRYTRFLVAASGGHCCPSINGIEQRAAREAEGVLLEYDDRTRRLALDLTAAYPPDAKLSKWVRTGTMHDDGTCEVRDRYDADGEVVHRTWFVEEPRVTADGVIETLTLHASLAPAPHKLEVQTFRAGDEHLALREYKPDQLLYRVDATYRATPGTTLDVRTTIQLKG
jgi:hypothetical protein